MAKSSAISVITMPHFPDTTTETANTSGQ